MRANPDQTEGLCPTYTGRLCQQGTLASTSFQTMKLPRKHRILTALIALFGMLFMQLAVASYACPGMKAESGSSGAAEVVQPAMPSMPDCDQQPDADQPAVCHAHCQEGKASLDKAEVPAVSPAAVMVSAIFSRLEPAIPLSLSDFDPPFFLQRDTAPPVSIRHCCFRI